jgi:hypothetical protein
MQGDQVEITGNGLPLLTFRVATGSSFTLSGTKGKHLLADIAFLLQTSMEVGSILQQSSTCNTHNPKGRCWLLVLLILSGKLILELIIIEGNEKRQSHLAHLLSLKHDRDMPL